MVRVGIVGAGKLGRTLAWLSVNAGFDVLVAGSGLVQRTARVLDVFAPGARAAEIRDVAASDIVVLALPLPDVHDIDAHLFDGRVVVDAMNHWAETDGPLDDVFALTSVAVQRHFAGARVVKTFNHIAYKDLAAGGRAAGDPLRWGVAVATDDEWARAVVNGWVDALGFTPVDAGALADTAVLQAGQPLFGAALPATELEARLSALRDETPA